MNYHPDKRGGLKTIMDNFKTEINGHYDNIERLHSDVAEAMSVDGADCSPCVLHDVAGIEAQIEQEYESIRELEEAHY